MDSDLLDIYAPTQENFYNTIKAARTRGEGLIQFLKEKNFGEENHIHDVVYTPTETAHLVGVSTQAIRKAETEKRLPPPQPNEKGRREGYSFEDIQNMRSVFNKVPGRAESDETVVISFPNYKGGAYKTSTSVHFAQGMAEKGYSILFLDADPQGTASHYFRHFPGSIKLEETCGPTLLAQEGHEILPFTKTQWPNIDLVPASAELYLVEMEMTRYEERLFSSKGRNSFESLLDAVDTLLEEHPDRWDMIIIDSPPALGHLTINALVASDICIVPTPAHFADYCSTIEFFRLVESVFGPLEDQLSIELKILITRFNSSDDESKFMAQRIKDTFKDLVLNNVISYTGEVGKGLIKMRSIYEQPKSMRGHREAYKRARGIFDRVNGEILDTIVKPMWEEGDL